MKTFSLILAAALSATTLAGCMTEMDLSESVEELSVNQWQPNTRISGQASNRPPGLAWFNNRVYMVHTGSDSSDLWFSKRNESDKSWTTNTRIGGHTSSGGPSLVVWGGKLTMIYRPSGQNRLVMTTMNSNETWTPATSVGVAADVRSAPSAAVAGGKLFIGYCAKIGDEVEMQVDVLDRAGWRSTWTSSNSDDCETAALGASGATLHAAYTTLWNPWWASAIRRIVTRAADVRGDVVTWGPIDVPSMSSKTPMSLVSCGGNMHMIHGGGDSKSIWWSVYQTGAWQPDVEVSGQYSSAGAQLGCAGTVPFMIHNGEDRNDLWYSEFR